jgi:hypothetical protein
LGYVPCIFAGFAAVLGMAGNIYCQTVSFPQKVGGATLYTGVFGYRTKDWAEINDNIWVFTTCQSYSVIEDEFGFAYDEDKKMRTVQAFAITAPVVGGLMLIFACLAPCLTPGTVPWKLLGLMFLLVCLFQGLTLMVIQSSVCLDNPVLQYLDEEFPVIRATFPDECEWDAGFRLSLTAVVFWFVAGAATLALPAPVPFPLTPAQTQDVTNQQNADGTAEETNVVVQGTQVPIEEPEEGEAEPEKPKPAAE